MNEATHRLNDSLTKWFSCILAVGGFLVARSTYVKQQEATREQTKQFEQTRRDAAQKDLALRKDEYRRSLWQRQLDLYIEASRMASTIATSSKRDAERAKAIARFDQLFYGDLCVVESPSVARAMVEFRAALDGDETNLRPLAIALARACRESTEDVWHQDLGDVAGIRTGT